MKPPLSNGRPDDYQTPPHALNPLLAYLKNEWTIWEPAEGKGNLSIALGQMGYSVVGSDKYAIDFPHDFLEWEPEHFDCIITNPPFSLKQQFLERCYSLGKPFALLLPLTTFETKKRQDLFKRHGVQIVLFDRRINFETPNKVEKSSSWFATAWFTWGLNLPKELNFEVLQSI